MLLCVAIVMHLGLKNVDYMGGEFASQHVRATVAVAIGELPSEQRHFDFASSGAASNRFKQGNVRKKKGINEQGRRYHKLTFCVLKFL